MNFQKMRYFKVHSEVGSLSRASESLYISQQGLSKAVVTLESELSCKLFYRTPKGLVLTEEGEYFKQWVDEVLEKYEELQSRVADWTIGPNIIRCAAAQGVISEFAFDLVGEFKKKYPKYSVHIREYKDRLCDRMVEENEVDLGFGIEPIDRGRFECSNISEMQLVCVMHENHPWTKYDKIPLSALEEEKLFMVDEEFKSADYFIGTCAKHGITIRPRMLVGEVAAVHRLVRSHEGVGLTTATVAESIDVPNTVWRHFDCDDMKWTISIYKNRGLPLSEGAQKFYDHAIAAFRGR